MGPVRLAATYKRDDRGMWVVELDDDPRIHSYGRTLAIARTAIHDAAAQWAHVHPDDLDLVDNIALPEKAKAAVAKARQRRQQADKARDETVVLTRAAARYLVSELALTVRDAAELLAISPSRISQLLGEEDR